MKPEMKDINVSMIGKITTVPATPKVSHRRIIRTALKNDYVKSLVLNKGVDVKILKRTKTTFDCRQAEISNFLQ
jgi:hypothetical protein